MTLGNLMSNLTKSIEEVIKQFKRFPTVGEKSATRFAYFLMRQPKGEVKKLLSAIVAITKDVKFCGSCNNLDDRDPCGICSNPKRDASTVCVVESAVDLRAIERTKKYNGRYFVLHGVLSPLDGVAPKDLKINKLIELVKNNKVKEVILATNPRVQGETTANYIKGQLSGSEVKVSRIAYGIPVGGELEFIDSVSLVRSLEGRRRY